jgi:DNA polymerase-3 subunit epsilon
VDFLSEYSSFTRNVDFAGRIVLDDQQREVFNFGKYKGRLVEEVLTVDPSYYSWMMRGEFALNTKQVLSRIYKRLTGRH